MKKLLVVLVAANPRVLPPCTASTALLDPVGARRPRGVLVKKLLVVLVAAAALLAPAAASAHPLGNFTINRFARVEVAGHRLYVRYVLDLAEIPTYQARQDGVDPAVYARRVARGLHVTVGGRPVVLRPVARALAFPRGVAGLHTMRLEVILRGPAVDGTEALTVHDTNYAGRIGWKEIVVGASTRSLSDELHAYPKSLLQSPLDVTQRARDDLARPMRPCRSSRRAGRSRRPTASPTAGSRS